MSETKGKHTPAISCPGCESDSAPHLHGCPNIPQATTKHQPSSAQKMVWPCCPKCGVSMLAMRDRLTGVAVACSGKETHFFELKHLEQFAQFFPLEQLVAALRAIANGDYHPCECKHDDENCCNKVGAYCPKCIAEVALRAAGEDVE